MSTACDKIRNFFFVEELGLLTRKIPFCFWITSLLWSLICTSMKCNSSFTMGLNLPVHYRNSRNIRVKSVSTLTKSPSTGCKILHLILSPDTISYRIVLYCILCSLFSPWHRYLIYKTLKQKTLFIHTLTYIYIYT